MTKHGRLIDADALEKDGWMMHRTVQVDNNTMEYQTKKPTDFPTIEPEQKWIPVSERLPEVVVGEHDIRCSEDVLVYDGDDLRVGYFVRIEKFDRGYWNIYGDDCFEPIAWMPLPEPYKAESEG